jgi:penicillin amidase
MELNRRAAHGELSALLGKATLQVDRLSRTLGFSRSADLSWKTMDADVREDVEAYVSGVNAMIHSGESLPIEFSLLRHRPSRWQAIDCVAYGRLQMWALTHGAMGELVKARLIEAVGAEAVQHLFPIAHDDLPVTLPNGIELNRLDLDEMTSTPFGPFMGKGAAEGAGLGSNGWVVAPHMSATGNGILCNDMHLPIGVPSLWHYQHLKCEDEVHVSGFTLPGIPYVLVGHNERIAWGATLSYVDCEDLFVEQVRPGPVVQFRVGDHWRAPETVAERITVRWDSDHLEEVLISRNGPIVSKVLEGAEQMLALGSTALRAASALEGFRSLNRAGNWETFVDAVGRIEAPSLNLLYADIAGNIGHYVAGRAPVRAKGDGTVPVPGWDDEYAWEGDIPFPEMPHALNPSQGFIISANHQIVDTSYPHYLGQMWRSGYRARRIHELMSGRSQISTEDCRLFQIDVTCDAGKRLVDRLEALQVTEPDAQLALALLREWDGKLGPESVGGSIYQVLLTRLAHRIVGVRLNEDLMHELLGRGPNPVMAPVNEFHGHWPAMLERLLAERPSFWLPKGSQILEQCLTETSAELRARLGEEPEDWTWGRLHRISLNHALSSMPELDAIFGLGRWPIGGDSTTVAQTSVMADLTTEGDAVSVSTRQVVDLGELSSTLGMLVPGQSGWPGSPNYDDLVGPWLAGDYFQAAWRDNDVIESSVAQLNLLPTEV